MKCPNCNSNVTGATCRQCGLDMALYDKSVKVSLVLYNKGLELANGGRLSDAIEVLVKSVEFDKKNTTARNLLGLCCFAVGRINEALKEWVISTSYDKNDNLADSYLEDFQKNNRQVQRYDDSAHMYNQALLALRQKSEDIAVIHLRKSVEYNPNFVDALNLLCLCYLSLKDKSKAGGCIDKVLEIDVNNKIALSYFRELYPTRTGPDSRIKSEYTPKANLGEALFGRKLIDKQLIPHLPVSQFVSFLIGVICTVAVIYILILPSTIHKYEDEQEALSLSMAQMQTSYEADVTQKDAKIEELQKELDNQNAKNAALLNDIDVQERVQKVNTANGYLLENKAEDAVSYLATIETYGLPPETIELYNHIMDTARPMVEADYYSQGIAAYNAKRYDDCKIFFEKSVSYAALDSKTIGESYYYLGRVAELAGDNERARQYYESVVNNYKDSNRYAQAKTQLANLN